MGERAVYPVAADRDPDRQLADRLGLVQAAWAKKDRFMKKTDVSSKVVPVRRTAP